jgi:dipeptidyl aminopeptidase/acylaminoacyl peptidase
MTEDRLRELLHTDPSAAEREAEERGWAVVKAAYAERAPGARPRSQRALVLGLAGAVLLGALLLSPAGAQVREWIEDVVQPGEENAAPSLTALPAPGRLLVESESGPWIVNEDGSKRHLPAYDEAAWSPNGRFVAVSRGRELIAVVADPEATGEQVGVIRWSYGAPTRVHDIAWAPSGTRIAYRAGDDLRLIAGDSSEPRVLVEDVGSVAPTWQPLSPAERAAVDPATGIVAEARNALAYVDADQVVRVVRVDSEKELWHAAPFEGGVRALAWSPDGRSLLAVGTSFYSLYGPDGRTTLKGPTEAGVTGAAFSPAGGEVAVNHTIEGANGTRSLVSVIELAGSGARERRLYAGPGRFTDVTWSPDGSTLLVAWPAANQWLFLDPDQPSKPEAVTGIARQFDPGGRGPAAFPTISGWCCAP